MAAPICGKRVGAIAAAAAIAVTLAAASPPAYAFGPGDVFGMLGGLVGTLARPFAPYYRRSYAAPHYVERRVPRRPEEEHRPEPVEHAEPAPRTEPPARLADADRGDRAAAPANAPVILLP